MQFFIYYLNNLIIVYIGVAILLINTCISVTIFYAINTKVFACTYFVHNFFGCSLNFDIAK